MSWLDLYPDDLIERYEPSDALEFLRKQAPTSASQLEKLDYFLGHWTLVLLQRADDPQGVQEMLTLCEIAQSMTDKGSIEQLRWNGFEDLLEGKRLYLKAHAQAHKDKAPVQLKQQSRILELIQQSDSARIKQSELPEELNLSKGRVSQILGLLESRLLITRQREGKESWVKLAQNSSAPLTPSQARPASDNNRPSKYSGRNVLSLQKIAA